MIWGKVLFVVDTLCVRAFHTFTLRAVQPEACCSFRLVTEEKDRCCRPHERSCMYRSSWTSPRRPASPGRPQKRHQSLLPASLPYCCSCCPSLVAGLCIPLHGRNLVIMRLHRSLPSRPGLSHAQSRSRSTKAIRAANDAKQGSRETEKGPDLGLKAAWVGAELLGDVSAKLKKADDSSPPAPSSSSANRATAGTPMTLSQVVASIKDDYAVDYFISGKGEMAAYAPDCLFKDDFASFRGVDRFKKNVANLGALLSEVDLQVASLEPVGDAAVEAHWRFSGVLDLPWRPRLAAAGSTTHVIDTSRGCVVEHIEKWKSDPKEVIARLLRPAASKPTTPWEVFMHSLFGTRKNYKVAWYVISRRVTLLAAPAVAAAVATHALTGHGLPAVLGGGVVEGLAGALFVAGLLTELAMIADGNQL